MDTFAQDVRYGIRMLVKNAGFTAIAIFTLALGIGANTAIFSVVNSVLLRPLPYPHGDRLVAVPEVNIHTGISLSVPPADFLDWRSQNEALEDLAAFTPNLLTLTGVGEPERFHGLSASAELFSLLADSPLHGRFFVAEENQAGRDQVVVLTSALWQKRFGSDPKIIGTTINLNERPFEVIGVLPPEFDFAVGAQSVEMITPLFFTPEQMQRTEHYLRVIGRLRPGVTIEQAQASMDTIAGRLQQQYPDTNKNFGARVTGLRDALIGDSRAALLVLWGAVAFVLLIAAANVANLLLARGAARQRELAIRTALGAGRWRISRQLLTESVLLAVAGGAVGVLFAFWGVDLLARLGPEDIYGLRNSSIDLTALVFTLSVSVLTGLIFGLAPAIQAFSKQLTETLKEESRGASGRNWMRRGLTVFEVAAALLLLIGAGLLINSFVRLQRVDMGYNPNQLLLVRTILPEAKYKAFPQIVSYYEGLLDQIRNTPGVVAAAATTHPPIVSGLEIIIQVEGKPDPGPGDFRTAINHAVTPNYFQTMGIPVIQGRDFTRDDIGSSAGSAVVNEAFVRAYYPGEDPIGRRVKWAMRADDPQRPWLSIIGVVGDTRDFGPDSNIMPAVYMSYAHMPNPVQSRGMFLAIRTSSDPMLLTKSVRDRIWSIEKDAPIPFTSTLDQVVSDSVSTPRFRTLLLGLFAGLALLLAAVGVYGVISYTVTQQTREIGIRMAIGAQQVDVVRLVMGAGLRLTAIGLVIGLGAAFGLTRVIETFLFGVTPTDPGTFVAISLLLVGVALLASYLPARRASRIDPVVALRYE